MYKTEYTKEMFLTWNSYMIRPRYDNHNDRIDQIREMYFFLSILYSFLYHVLRHYEMISFGLP